MMRRSTGISSSDYIEMNNGLKKGPWTPEEDKILSDYIEKNGHGSWRALPKLAGLNRCGKSCRLRWTNYLRPDIKRGNFSQEEEQTIINLHALFGNKWSAISGHLPGRTDNEIKNFWNTHLKKKLLQMGMDPVTHRPRILLTPPSPDLYHYHYHHHHHMKLLLGYWLANNININDVPQVIQHWLIMNTSNHLANNNNAPYNHHNYNLEDMTLLLLQNIVNNIGLLSINSPSLATNLEESLLSSLLSSSSSAVLNHLQAFGSSIHHHHQQQQQQLLLYDRLLRLILMNCSKLEQSDFPASQTPQLHSQLLAFLSLSPSQKQQDQQLQISTSTNHHEVVHEPPSSNINGNIGTSHSLPNLVSASASPFPVIDYNDQSINIISSNDHFSNPDASTSTINFDTWGSTATDQYFMDDETSSDSCWKHLINMECSRPWIDSNMS